MSFSKSYLLFQNVNEKNNNFILLPRIVIYQISRKRIIWKTVRWRTTCKNNWESTQNKKACTVTKYDVIYKSWDIYKSWGFVRSDWNVRTFTSKKLIGIYIFFVSRWHPYPLFITFSMAFLWLLSVMPTMSPSYMAPSSPCTLDNCSFVTVQNEVSACSYLGNLTYNWKTNDFSVQHH